MCNHYIINYYCFTIIVFFRNDAPPLTIGRILVLYSPVYVLQFFIWIVFAVIASVMCYRSCRKKEKHTGKTRSESRKNFGVLVLLFTFLGIPWLFAVTVFTFNFGFNIIVYVAFIIDVLQGPVLFVIRAVRLKEVRQFWRQLLCCCKPAQTRNSCHRCLA